MIKFLYDGTERPNIYTNLKDEFLCVKQSESINYGYDFEDYKREFGDTPFGLLIRKVAKLERDAAMNVFSKFINDENLNHRQITFVRKIIDYVVQNGYMESVSLLTKAPFDKP